MGIPLVGFVESVIDEIELFQWAVEENHFSSNRCVFARSQVGDFWVGMEAGVTWVANQGERIIVPGHGD